MLSPCKLYEMLDVGLVSKLRNLNFLLYSFPQMGLHMLLHHLQVQVLNGEVQIYSPQTIMQAEEINILHNVQVVYCLILFPSQALKH